MSTFQHNLNTHDEAELLPDGERVNSEFIADGLMEEITIRFNGEPRHLPAYTEAGMAKMKAEYEAEGIRDWEAIQPEGGERQLRAQWAAEQEDHINEIASFASNNQGNPRYLGACTFTGPDGADVCVDALSEWWGVDLGADGRGGVLTGNVVYGSLHDQEPRTMVLLPPLPTQQPDHGNILALGQGDAVGLALALVDTLDIDHKDALERAMKQLTEESTAGILVSDLPAAEEPMVSALADLPDTFMVVDDDGAPLGMMDMDRIQDDGLNLAFTLAAHCGDEDKTEQILAEQVKYHGTQGIGYVLIAAIKHMTNDILAGAFDVMEAATGTEPRAKMAEIAAMDDIQPGT